ncbi:MAG: four helix bundle protein [Chitinophagaceae bacterium]
MIRLEELEVYKASMEIGDIIWKIVEKCNYFQKDTIGKQLTRSADSIALNISEGYGRYHYAENRNFCWYSRGSIFETSTAIQKAAKRNLLPEEEYNLLKLKLLHYFKLINPYIKSIRKQKVAEQVEK